MDKLKMQTVNKADENFKKLAAMFPNAVTETIDENGEVVRAIDKDVLMQEINTRVVDGKEERYQFTWPDKKKSVLLANAPISKTLRPCREESVDFDTTENLYIEGDNLEVLKLLQETYLGKIKVIYIDPPYNTGTDFVYNDDFAQSTEEYLANSGQFDDVGNRLVTNTECNGRFHTDWLNMIYPRLRLAKDLLADDGAIFVSIDEHEHENLIHIMNEIFGESNYIDSIVWDKKGSAKGVPPRNMMVMSSSGCTKTSRRALTWLIFASAASASDCCIAETGCWPMRKDGSTGSRSWRSRFSTAAARKKPTDRRHGQFSGMRSRRQMSFETGRRIQNERTISSVDRCGLCLCRPDAGADARRSSNDYPAARRR